MSVGGGGGAKMDILATKDECRGWRRVMVGHDTKHVHVINPNSLSIVTEQ